MKPLTRISAIFERTIGLLAFLAATLLILVTLVVGVEVATRFVTGHATFWVIEVSEYCLLFITFLGTAWLLKEDGHVKMEVVLTRLKPRTQALLNTITSMLGVIICLAVAWYSTEATWRHFQLGYFIDSTLRPPKWIMLAIIAVGSSLLCIQFLRRTLRYLKGWRALGRE